MMTPKNLCSLICNEWLSLPSITERLGKMPSAISAAVNAEHRKKWVSYRSAGDMASRVRIAVMLALDSGTPLPEDVFKLQNATLRDLDKRYGLSRLPLHKQIEILCRHPRLTVILYARYGSDAINEWTARRRHNQNAQSRWTEDRESTAAIRCRQLYGGLPPLRILYKSKDPLIIGLANRLSKPGAIDRFCKKHGLERVLTQAPSGSWSSLEGKEYIKNLYRNICMEKGRYVNDYELSSLPNPLPTSVKKDYMDLAYNTLRSYIKTHLKTSVKELFKELCKTGELPKKWINHLRTPTTADDVELDSWTEVRWWEHCISALKQLPDDHPLRETKIIPHPLIGDSHYKSDFHFNGSYIEVLRHPFKKIETPTGKDSINYAKKIRARCEEYARQDLKVLLVEPAMLTDPKKLTDHFEELFKYDSNETISLKIIPSSEHPPGYWHAKKHRDQAVLKIRSPSSPHPARYPSFRLIISSGLGGFEAFLHINNKVDRQDEALRVNMICIGSGNNKPRLPTIDHLLTVCRYHRSILLDDNNKVTKKTISKTFGFGAYAYLSDISPNLLDFLTEKICARETLPPQGFTVWFPALRRALFQSTGLQINVNQPII